MKLSENQLLMVDRMAEILVRYCRAVDGEQGGVLLALVSDLFVNHGWKRRRAQSVAKLVIQRAIDRNLVTAIGETVFATKFSREHVK